jgi:hypothetical protein
VEGAIASAPTLESYVIEIKPIMIIEVSKEPELDESKPFLYKVDSFPSKYANKWTSEKWNSKLKERELFQFLEEEDNMTKVTIKGATSNPNTMQGIREMFKELYAN